MSDALDDILVNYNSEYAYRDLPIAKAALQDLFYTEVLELIGEDEPIVQLRKPTHGNCCTCQVCGEDHDTCQCAEKEERNEWRAELRAKAKAKYRQKG